MQAAPQEVPLILQTRAHIRRWSHSRSGEVIGTRKYVYPKEVVDMNLAYSYGSWAQQTEARWQGHRGLGALTES
jgi:hypothetical protein